MQISRTPKKIAFLAAQKLGLVDAPEQPLTDSAWQEVKQKSNERDDSVLPCVICKEDFGLEQQVSQHLKRICFCFCFWFWFWFWFLFSFCHMKFNL